MGFLRPRREHLHRRFIGMDYAMFENSIAQGIDQRLQLHTTVAAPLREGRAGDGQTGPTKNRLLTIER